MEQVFVKDKTFKVRVIVEDGKAWFSTYDIVKSMGKTSALFNNYGMSRDFHRIYRRIPVDRVGSRAMLFVEQQTIVDFLERSVFKAAEQVLEWLNSEVFPKVDLGEKKIVPVKVEKVKPIQQPDIVPAMNTPLQIGQNFIFCVAGNNPALVMDALTKFMSGNIPVASQMVS